MRLRKKKGHWREVDFRYASLRITLEGLENSLKQLEDFCESTDWYDGLFFREDAEPIYGLALIALQNYINSSIYDFDDTLSNKISLYSYDAEVKNGVTRIQLIICLANYYKHRDDSRELHRGTASVLDTLELKYGEDFDIDTSPIFNGIAMLDPKWDLAVLMKVVKDWRERLWETLVE